MRKVAAANIKFSRFGCGYYSSSYPLNTFDKKSIFFLHFDIISKCPLPDISTKQLLMSPFYASKVEIFQCWLYLSAGTKCAGIV